MKLSYLQMTAASALVLISSVAFGQTAAKAPAATGVSAKLIAQEKVLLESVVKHDVKTFSALIAPGAGSVDEGGYMAVANTLTQKGTFQGQPVPPTVYATTTWVNRGGKWLV